MTEGALPPRFAHSRSIWPSRTRKRLLAFCLATALAGCGDWPEAPGGVPPGPWPRLVPLGTLDLSPAEPPRTAGQEARAAGLAARAARLGGVERQGVRRDALEARASILRGPAATEAEREAMRARLARL